MSTTAKGSILESITEILQKSLATTKTIITKNKKIIDLDGIEREIDIYVETFVNKEKFNTVIECKNYKKGSNIDIDKISAFGEKCNRLPLVHRKVFITASDYQSGAIKKAKVLNVELYKIVTENINTRSESLGIESFSVIDKKCKILNISFHSAELSKTIIDTEEKLSLYYKKDKLLIEQELKEAATDVNNIWRFLATSKGLLFNYKKIIYPHFTVGNIYTKYKDQYYKVNSIRLKVELEMIHRQIEISQLKNYVSLGSEKSLATFSEVEFIKDNIKYCLYLVKPIDEDKPKIFLSAPNKKEGVELENLASFGKDSFFKSLTIPDDIKNITIEPYEFGITSKVVESAKNNHIEIGRNENLSQNKSEKNILFGIDPKNKKLFFMIPVPHDTKFLTAKFPDPISLYFNHAIELFHNSEHFKNTMVETAPEDNVLLLQDSCYYKYLQNSVGCVFMLRSAIETFVNSCIKDDISIEINSVLYTKLEIESSFNLKEKILQVPPFSTEFFPDLHKEILHNIFELDALSKDLHNLKTSGEVVQPFMHTFEKLINFDAKECINAAKKFFAIANNQYQMFEM